jgi:hypothetical protein
MVEEKSHSFFSWHRSQSSELGRNSRRFSYFTSAKQMAVLTLLSHQTIPVIAHKYAILINF